jgi:chorismate synthase
MNSLGRIFRISIWGESHGYGVGALIDGCPAGLELSAEELQRDLDRRRSGAPGTTPRREPDRPRILSGLFNGRTTGAPILLAITNQDVDSKDYEAKRWTPRPGHADFVAEKKYGGHHDYRGSGHFSGRLTAGLVMAGAVARKLIRPVMVSARLDEVGGFPQIEEAVQDAVDRGDSIGGIVRCHAINLPAGLGEPFFDSVESLISHAVFSIPAIKGVEFGSGFRLARMKGSEANDIIVGADGTTATNHAGGVNGGITNGNELVFRAVVKPTSSIPQEQQTVDLRTGERTVLRVEGRHDACIALRMPVVVEAVTAVVLADLMRIAGVIPPVLTG